MVSPGGRFVVFERRATAGALPTSTGSPSPGSALHSLTSGPADDHDAVFSADGKSIVFVRTDGPRRHLLGPPVWRRPGAPDQDRGIDEFSPRFFAGGIVFSRGDSGEAPGAYADVFTMAANGTKVKPLVAGVGSAYVEDVTGNGDSCSSAATRASG